MIKSTFRAAGFPVYLMMFTAVFLFNTFNTFAQEESMLPDPGNVNTITGPVLSEQDVVNQALEYSRKLKSYSTNVQIAEYRYKSSGLLENPELRLRDITTRNINESFDEVQVGLRLRFPDLGELGQERQQAQVEIWKQKVEEIRYQQKLVARIRRNYATVLMYDRQAELDFQRVRKEKERINIVKHMVELGNRSVVYYTKAKMWQAAASNDYTRTIQKQSLVRRELAKRSGISENAEFVMDDLPEIKLDPENLIQLAIQNRPEIELVRQRITLAERRNKYERLQRFPWLNFVEVSYHNEDRRDENWSEVMLGLKLPLLDRNRGNIKAADLAARMKESEYDAIRESIEDEVRLAYTVYKDLLLDWNNFRVYANELISNAQTVVEQAKQHEVLLPDEVMEMELTIIDTKKLLNEKRQNLAHALIDLYYAIGIENYDQIIANGAGRGSE